MADILTDQAACTAVMHRYASSVDSRDFISLRSCFTDECTLAGYAPPAPALVEGGDAIVAYISTALQRYGRTQHMLGQCTVSIDGDLASAETYVQAFHLLADDPQMIVDLWGIYRDRMARRADTWIITEHRIDVIHVERRLSAGR